MRNGQRRVQVEVGRQPRVLVADVESGVRTLAMAVARVLQTDSFCTSAVYKLGSTQGRDHAGSGFRVLVLEQLKTRGMNSFASSTTRSHRGLRMDDDTRAAFRERLQQLLNDLANTLGGAEARSRPVSLDDPIGRLSRVDAMQQQHMAEAQARITRNEMGAVRQALARIEHGTFGDCMECGAPIPVRRLEAKPTVTLCVACQREREA